MLNNLILDPTTGEPKACYYEENVNCVPFLKPREVVDNPPEGSPDSFTPKKK